MEKTILSKENNPLGLDKEGKLLYKFAVPSCVALVVNALYNIVDQVFIGQYIGPVGNAATNVSFPFVTICLSLALLIGIGAASRFSLYLGAGRNKEAKVVVANSVITLFVLAIILTTISLIFTRQFLYAFGADEEVMPYALQYAGICALGYGFVMLQTSICALARADGSPKFSMLAIVLGAVINTILDPIFIAVFNLGISGAAIATVIGQFASFLLSFSYLWRFKTIHLTIKDFKFDLRESFKTASLGISSFANQVNITFLQIVMNNTIKFYGAKSIYGSMIPLAACGIVFKCNAILLSIVVGISQAAQAIIGFNYGAEKYGRVKKTLILAATAAFVACFIGFLAFQLIPDKILSIFGTGTDLYFHFAIYFMRVYLFTVPFTGIQIVCSNYFSAVGKPMVGLFLAMTRTVIFLIPLLLIFPLFWGLEGILYTAPVADTLALIVTMTMITRELKTLSKRNSSTSVN